MSTKETARSAGTLVQEVNTQLNIPKKVNLWMLTQYFWGKETLERPMKSPLLCRDPEVEMVAKMGHRVKISLQSPTFAPHPP